MHYLLTVIETPPTRSTTPRPERSTRSTSRLKTDGHWVSTAASSPRPRDRTDDGHHVPCFTDGPFVESKEYLAGFWVVEADDLDAALKLAARASKACSRKVEVRPFDGIA